MNEQKISQILINKGKSLISRPREIIQFTNNQFANILLNDIENRPHAFLLACLLDRQIKAESAWLIPFRLLEKIGDFSFRTLNNFDLKTLEGLMRNPEPLHRFPNEMAKNLYYAIQLINKKYFGDAKKIWEEEPSSAQVVYRFLEFRGVGQKIGTMATNILARDYKIKFSDYYSIDISIDVHVQRVIKRLGLVDKNASNEQIIYRARSLHPKFPGILDLPIWEIGQNWCKSQKPLCNECYLENYCLKSI